MLKFFTAVTLIFAMGCCMAEDELHLHTLDIVETMLWSEGVSFPAGTPQPEIVYGEEMSLALDLLDS